MYVFHNKHYITVDEQNRIVNGFSDAFRQPAEDDICINERGGYQFRLFQGGEENPALYTPDGIPRYRWDGTQAVLRTEEELEADRAAQPEPVIPPTNAELAAESKRLKQQVSALTDQQSFYEDCIAEMATVVYA